MEVQKQHASEKVKPLYQNITIPSQHSSTLLLLKTKVNEATEIMTLR